MYLQPWQPRHLLMHSVTEACQPDCRARMLRVSAPLEPIEQSPTVVVTPQWPGKLRLSQWSAAKRRSRE